MTVTDLALSKRLEYAEARANVAFVEALARREPDVGATWREVGGAFAMYAGVGSPITQTFGLGLAAAPDDAQLDAIESFFDARGAATHHEVSPLADESHLATLAARGYRAIELTSIMHRALDRVDTPDGSAFRVRRIEPGEEPRWAEAAALAWSAEAPALGPIVRRLGLLTAHAEGTVPLVAEAGDDVVATAALVVRDGVAILAGGSTRVEWRGRGAQTALLRARLRHARDAGCDLAMMGARPGSASQRNAERQGFRIAYTRIKWARETNGGDT